MRVIYKSPARDFTRRGKKSTYFTVKLIDSSGEIRASLFATIAERWDSHLNIGQVYIVRNGRVQLANKNFKEGTRNDYELSFTDKTTVEIAEEDDNVPQDKYYFATIEDILTKPAEEIVDVIGIALSIDNIVTITTKTDKTVHKREIVLWDTTEKSISLTMWAGFASTIDKIDHLGQVLAIKNVRISDWHGKTINTTNTSTIVINPELPEADKLATLKLKQ